MGRGKALTEDEKAAIIKESAKGTSSDAIAAKIGRHVDKVKRFQKKSQTMKVLKLKTQLKQMTNKKTMIKVIFCQQ